ncbi:MAG TPA: efflux RND transporter periplasmic adaptor subunit [Xanthobacteraceae bacterium]|nr:efflux RND transporter periplasmic adaptor subunit [Xanthobacteraceae bacterium]
MIDQSLSVGHSGLCVGRRTLRVCRGLGPCAALLVLTACGQQNAYVPPPPPKVAVAQPLQQQVPLYVELTGNLKAYNEVKLEARVQGFLEQQKYVDGANVKKSDTLFVIQQNTYQAQLDQAKATLESNQASQANAQVEYTRQTTLGQQQFASQSRVDDAKTKLAETSAAVLGAQANLEVATINLGYTEVTAPFDGVASRHLVSVGALVGVAGPTELASVVQIDPIYVYFEVAETVVQRVKEALNRLGKTFRDVHDIPVEIGLQIEEGYPHKGVIDYIAPQIDASTGTLQVRGIFDNKDYGLLPGMFARVRVPIRRPEPALLIPDTALGTNQLGRYLLVVNKDNVVEQRTVTIGQVDNGLRVIESGIKPDDWVVIDGIQRAIPSSKVEPDKQKVKISTAGG